MESSPRCRLHYRLLRKVWYVQTSSREEVQQMKVLCPYCRMFRTHVFLFRFCRVSTAVLSLYEEDDAVTGWEDVIEGIISCPTSPASIRKY